MSSVLRAIPSQIMVSKEPAVIHFEASNGAIVVVYHAATKLGGGVLLKHLQSSSGQVVQNLLKAMSGSTKADPREFAIKLAGPSIDLEHIKKTLEKLDLKVSGELLENEKNLEAFFYTESGRFRIGEKAESQTSPPKVVPVRPAVVAPRARRRVLIVDDSKTIRQLLTKVFQDDSRLEVVGAVANPLEVDQKILETKPDVITLDIHMPEMDGVTLLKTVIRPKHNIPVVMITSIRMEEGPQVLEALENGAVDYIQKPSLEELDRVSGMIVEKVITASHVKRVTVAANSKVSILSTPVQFQDTVCVGSSTGGTEALRVVLSQLPQNIPPMVIVQHIPAVFSTAFSRRLNDLLPFEVKEAADGDEVKAGRVLIAPGGLHMKLARGPQGGTIVRVTDDPPVNRFKPSVDYLFDSAADILGKRSIGIILTGMGRDGAQGLLRMHQKGARTIGQDEATSVVYGMPKAAWELGAVDVQLPLEKIPQQMWNWLATKEKKESSDV